MVKVKICGITNLQDAQAAIGAGCDALGFVFYKKSPRYIAPKAAADITARLPAKALKVGVFVNAPEKKIKSIAKLCNLDILQFHGEESPEFCKKFKGFKVIKGFRIKGKTDLQKIFGYKVFAYLFDTYVKAKAGGTGKKFNWDLLSNLRGIKCPVFLSGGLTEKNVLTAIKDVRPDWVDVSSSLEFAPGEKSPDKIKQFIKAVRQGKTGS